jgi:hypothetical protein
MSEEVKEEGSFKIKKKPGRPRKLNKADEPAKIDLSKKEEEVKTEENAIEEQAANEVPVRDESGTSEEVSKENVEEAVEKPTEESKEEEVSVITEIEDKEEEKFTPAEEPVAQQETRQLPENVDKLVKFMEETGGTVEDYVRLNADYSNVDSVTLLKEYYKHTRPHLNNDEVTFLLEDNFAYDEEVDEERDIRKKKLAYKEEIAKAKNFLDNLKTKYYDEIKLRPGVTQDMQKAMDFFNRYNEEQEAVVKQHESFKKNTQSFFTDNFKGFDFNVGEKKFRYDINDVDRLATEQSSLSNFLGKFLDEGGNVKDFNSYHKAIYSASNIDKIATNFYEQGKADAIKEINAKSKNISTEARQSPSGELKFGGFKIKAVNGVDSSKLKFKSKTK